MLSVYWYSIDALITTNGYMLSFYWYSIDVRFLRMVICYQFNGTQLAFLFYEWFYDINFLVFMGVVISSYGDMLSVYWYSIDGLNFTNGYMIPIYWYFIGVLISTSVYMLSVYGIQLTF